VLRPNFLNFGLQRGRNVPGRFIRDNGDALVRLEPKANPKGVARTGRKFGIYGIDRKTVRHCS
jgi:hypothetical protein